MHLLVSHLSFILCPERVPSLETKMRYFEAIFIASFVLAISTAAPIDDKRGAAIYGEHFEGDIVLTEAQRQAINTAVHGRNGMQDTTKRWPQATFVYYIQNHFDSNQLNMIQGAMDDISSKTCIKFRPWQDGDSFYAIFQGTNAGCYANIGYNGEFGNPEQNQVVNLANDCFSHGTVVHEIIHALGFYHMQSTYDRDNFVQIVWENIQQGMESNFDKYTTDTVTDFGVPYDYYSVMHYAADAFSSNGEPTIVPLQQNVKLEYRDAMSDSDVLKLNKMYCE